MSQASARPILLLLVILLVLLFLILIVLVLLIDSARARDACVFSCLPSVFDPCSIRGSLFFRVFRVFRGYYLCAYRPTFAVAFSRACPA